ncbi:TlpA family protein disulfide reductase [Flavivirga rizhaonensis]|uniref:TlpA family protein disulfide reductase n=1 Tax=Flavivirga rizhaonensis TaxID=2559571 RepID=A0A4S1DTV7_9FLAO|nr:TlpA disulfide reductase family protein [Flavivirga rizhaonensis]TGV01389.1 TlpA family protein disulfide reductase [Flavivirga rizhaonensis]
MKIIRILVLIVVIFITSCKPNIPAEKVDYAILSGKTIDYEGDLLLFKDYVLGPLKIEDDGSFKDTIKLERPVEYKLANSNGTTGIYLYPGANLHVEISNQDLLSAIKYSGNTAKESNYLLHKYTIVNKYSKENKTSVEPQKTYTAIENLYQALVTKLEEFNLPKAFKIAERRRLNYMRLNEFNSYKNRQLDDNKSFQLPKKYQDEIINLDINNEEDFHYTSRYRQLVLTQISNKAKEAKKKDSVTDLYNIKLKLIKAISNKYIKDEVAYKMTMNAMLGSSISADKLNVIKNDFLSIATNEDKKNQIIEIYNETVTTASGQPSPKFENYENYKEGTTSLDDLKGKYVYIDIWATWCLPCIQEIPALKKIEEQYHDKNIEFVSISVDSKKDFEKWKKFVKDKALTGIQLFADKSLSADFMKSYNVGGIPRFILIGTEGEIISSNAPRPSDKKFITLLNSLDI